MHPLLYGVLAVVAGCIGALPVIAFTHIRGMVRDRNLHLWPSVTRCRLCDKRIFAWQRHERRPMRMEVDNPDRVLFAVSGSSLVHTACKGLPVGHVSVSVVERRATP